MCQVARYVAKNGEKMKAKDYLDMERLKSASKKKPEMERRAMYDSMKKNPWTAALVGLCVTGLGRIYVTGEGWGNLLLLWFLCAILWLAMLGWIVWIYSMFDGYDAAKKYNEMIAQALDIVV